MELWMPGVSKIPTAAYGGYGPIEPVAIVNHIMQGYQQTMIRWAMERPYIQQKSAHFTIGRAGWIVQHVALNQASWASGSVREPTWRGLEYRAGRPINPNSYVVNIEHEGFSKDPVSYGYDYIYDDKYPWPEKMVEASIRVNKWVCEQLKIEPSKDTIIGHNVIDSVTRADDPGDMWPQDRVIQAIKSEGIPPPIDKTKAYYAIYKGRAEPIRREGKYGVYELRIEL